MTDIGRVGAGGVSPAVARLVDMIQSDYGSTKLNSGEVGAWLRENADAGQLSDLIDKLDQAMSTSTYTNPPTNSAPGGSAYPAGTRYAVIRRDELPS